MPEFILPAEADRCPHCNAVLRDPPNCCQAMEQEYSEQMHRENNPHHDFDEDEDFDEDDERSGVELELNEDDYLCDDCLWDDANEDD